MDRSTKELDALTEQVIGAAIEVHRQLGPGLLESVYRECLMMELMLRGINVVRERRVPVEYKGRRVKADLRIDLLVNECLIIEVKAIETLLPVHSAQVITYLKLTGFPAGLLFNFHQTTLRAGLRRIDHPDRYVRIHRASNVHDH